MDIKRHSKILICTLEYRTSFRKDQIMKKDINKNQVYEIMGMSIAIPLNYKGYIVRANILKDRKGCDFSVTYEIKSEGQLYWNCIDGDIFTLQTDKSINYEVYKMTMDKFASGYFKHFIDNYDLEMTAMNRGFDLLEQERISGNV